MSRSLSAWSCRVSLAERSRSRFDLLLLCAGSSLPSSGDAVDGHNKWEVQAFSDGFHTEPRRRCRVAEEGFHL
jgi:hypothetical protein